MVRASMVALIRKKNPELFRKFLAHSQPVFPGPENSMEDNQGRAFAGFPEMKL